MKKINLQQMSKDLESNIAYKNGAKVFELVEEFSEVNSKSTMIAAELVANLGKIIYEKSGDKSLIDSRVNGIFNTLKRKKEIIEEIRSKLNEVEREVIFQEETFGLNLRDLKSEE